MNSFCRFDHTFCESFDFVGILILNLKTLRLIAFHKFHLFPTLLYHDVMSKIDNHFPLKSVVENYHHNVV